VFSTSEGILQEGLVRLRAGLAELEATGAGQAGTQAVG
jgi:hypothetical protein